MKSWITRSRKLVFDGGRFLMVERHDVELPNGQIIPDWHWVVTPEFANVLAQTADGKFICFRQTKYAVSGPSLAPVGGYLEPGEKPLNAAKRELREETGYEASEWIPLGVYPVDGNRGVGKAHLYLARQARQVADPVADDLEEQELLFLDEAAISTALLQGQFKLLPWAANVALALTYLKSQ
jgi:ADP-ribose pyrophosphatase